MLFQFASDNTLDFGNQIGIAVTEREGLIGKVVWRFAVRVKSDDPEDLVFKLRELADTVQRRYDPPQMGG